MIQLGLLTVAVTTRLDSVCVSLTLRGHGARVAAQAAMDSAVGLVVYPATVTQKDQWTLCVTLRQDSAPVNLV